MPVTWCLANPKLDERDVTAGLLEVDHHLERAWYAVRIVCRTWQPR